MPGCRVYGCTSGYDTTHKRGPEKKYQLFSFPEAARLRNLWVARIHRENFQPTKNSKVCLKHFLLEDFQFVPGDLDVKGNERTKYRLKENAIPSLYLRGSQPDSNEPPRKKIALEADIQFNHTYAQKQDPVEQVEVEAPADDNNDLEDVIIATAQDVPDNELEILEDTSLTQQNYKKTLMKKMLILLCLRKIISL